MKIRWMLAVLTLTLTTQSIGFAGGRIEHHQITSQVLADKGKPSERMGRKITV